LAQNRQQAFHVVQFITKLPFEIVTILIVF
jgi:hypothetical protein